MLKFINSTFHLKLEAHVIIYNLNQVMHTQIHIIANLYFEKELKKYRQIWF